MDSSVTIEQEQYRQISLAVVDAVAERLGTDPEDLRPPLSEVVNPDALNALFAPTPSGDPRTGEGRVEFTYANQRVVVRADGTVHVEAERPSHRSDDGMSEAEC